jgi:hypothetical protein
MFSVLVSSTFTVQILYSLQLNCTYSNYTQAAAATSSAAQQHSTFTVQILYSLQLNCTYSNYTQTAAATCSAAQQHSTFTVQILYSLQLNCIYSNYTQAAAAATCSAAQEKKSPSIVFRSAVRSVDISCVLLSNPFRDQTLQGKSID